MTEDGRFERELSKACAYPSWDAPIVAAELFIGNCELSQDEPGISANAWR